MLDSIVIGCRHTTVELITTMLGNRIPVDAVVTIEASVSEKVDVSGFVDVAQFIPSHIKVYKLKSYGMSAEEDRSILSELRYRVGFCAGWQRLIPDWFLNQAEVGVFGMHASRHYLPGGRGRSPITWSIIEGAAELHATVFKYAAAADEGAPLDICEIEITAFDTIHSLQQKCRIAFNRIIQKHYPRLSRGHLPSLSFPRGVSSWYDKRTPDSGHIHWRQKAQDIHNFIRAQTKPYPGAFAVVNNTAFRIWSGHPFGRSICYDENPGTILDRFFDGRLLVQCEDMPLYVIDHELKAVSIGEVLS